jgi:topoisomerase-4 subunit A
MKKKLPQQEFSFDAWADPQHEEEATAPAKKSTKKSSKLTKKTDDDGKKTDDGGSDITPPADAVTGSHGPLRDMIDRNFLEYASYVICDRAIPTMEDGLKPVQRRILWSLHENDDGRFTKVANIVGHCMQYHPHGDASIADALINLTNKRYLIEGQGNFGNPLTGDAAAASRYIECRLTPLARKEIFNDDLTPFVANYDGRKKEPVILPSKLPLLLMLGAEGIAVGMSTRLLPHNFAELIEAQIAILQKKPFKVLPDFFQGGEMDVSDYDNGNGKIKLRARFKKTQGARLVINEVPFGSTTESLISSIEDAVRKKKVPIRAINDFTAEHVEIELLLSPGTSQDKAIKALYAFTGCEHSISARAVVIQKNRPVDTTVSEILRENTAQCLEIIRQELELKKQNLLDALHQKTLVQIFIENRIYKRIEECKTAADVRTAILDGFKPFKKKLLREIDDQDLEMLLSVRIRRISLFDINKSRQDIEGIMKELEQVKKDLARLKSYVIRYLRNLLKTYGKLYPRCTQISTFSNIEVRELTATELKIGYDPERDFIGHNVGGETLFECSSYDKLVFFSKDGRYWVMPPPERFFVDGGMMLAGKADRDQQYTMVYTDKESGFTYMKRFTLGGFILEKEYRTAPEGATVLLLETGTPEAIYVKYKPAKGQRIHQQMFNPGEILVKGAKAKGNQMTAKRIARIDSSKPRWWNDEDDPHKGHLL